MAQSAARTVSLTATELGALEAAMNRWLETQTIIDTTQVLTRVPER